MPIQPEGPPSNMDLILRRVCMYASPPGIILLIAHGIASRSPFPALGVIPLVISVGLSAVVLRGNRIALGKAPTESILKWLFFVIDFFISVAHLSLLIPTWASLTYYSGGYNMGYWRGYNMGVITLEVYATVFMIFDGCAHLYLAGVCVWRKLKTNANRCTCPHCPHHQAARYRDAIDALEPTEHSPLAQEGRDEETPADNHN